MRIILVILICISFISLKAQSQMPLSVINPAQMGYFGSYGPYNLLSDSTQLNKKWSLSKYGGFSTSFGFFNGGNATVFSAPIGLQVNRRLTNNLYAFAGVSVAPSYFNMNQSFANPGFYKMNPGATQFSSRGFGMYSRVEAGLMYVNDDRTFSISGSIGVDRSSYPVYYPSNRTNTQRQAAPVGTRQ